MIYEVLVLFLVVYVNTQELVKVTQFRRLSVLHGSMLECASICSSDDQCYGYMVTSGQCRMITDVDVPSVCAANPSSSCYTKNIFMSMIDTTTTLESTTTSEATTTPEQTTPRPTTTPEPTTPRPATTPEPTTTHQESTTVTVTIPNSQGCVESIRLSGPGDVYISFHGNDVLPMYAANATSILADTQKSQVSRSTYYVGFPADIRDMYSVSGGSFHVVVIDGKQGSEP